MPDYDLGTAHGRIQIDNDSRGAAQAARELAALRAAAQSLNTAFQGLDRSSSAFDRDVTRISRSAVVLQRSLNATVRTLSSVTSATARGGFTTITRTTNAFTGALTRLGSTAGNVAGQVAGLNTATTSFERTLASAIQTARTAQATFESLTSVSAVARSIANSITGIGQAMEQMPSWVRQLQGFSGRLAAVGAGATFAARNASRGFSLLRAGMLGVALSGGRAGRSLTLLSRGMGATAAGASALVARSARATAAVNSLRTAVQRAAPQMPNLWRGLTRGFGGISLAITGIAAVRASLTGLTRVARQAGLALGALSLAAGAIRLAGGGIANLANALGTLSGVILAVPGALAQFGIASGVARLATSRLGEAFSAAALEGEEFWTAIEELSPVLREVAIAANLVRPAFENLREIAEGEVLRNLGRDIQQLSQRWMPALEATVTSVGQGLNRWKDQGVDFLMDPRTMSDFRTMASDTARSLNILSFAVQPVLRALSNIAVVGSQAFREFTPHIVLATKQFEMFTSRNRDNGQFSSWIRNSIQGWRDLKDGIRDTTAGLGSFFGAFGAGSGANSLERFSEWAAQFRENMAQSANGGALDFIGSGLERTGERMAEVIGIAMRGVIQALQAAQPFLDQLTDAFSSRLVQAIEIATQVLVAFANALGAIPGLGGFLGMLLGTAAAVKILAFALRPAIRLLTGLFGVTATAAGAAMALRNFQNVARAGFAAGGISGATRLLGQNYTAVQRVTQGYTRASQAANRFAGNRLAANMAGASRGMAMLNGGLASTAMRLRNVAGVGGAAFGALRSGLSGLTSLVGGPWMAALMALGAAFFAIRENSKTAGDIQEEFARRTNASANAARDFAGAIREANGQLSDVSIAEEATRQYEELLNTLDQVSQKESGTMRDIGGYLTDVASVPEADDTGVMAAIKRADPTGLTRINYGNLLGGGENNAANSQLDHIGQQAARAKEQFEKLGLTAEQVGAKLADLTGTEFASMRQDLLDLGATEAVAEIDRIRAGLEQAKASAEAIGPSTFQLANALDVLGNKASTAAEKLDAMKSALQAMGLLTLGPAAAMQQLRDEVDSFVQTISQIDFAALGPLGEANIFEGMTNNLNLANEAATTAARELEGLSTEFLTSATATENAAQAYAEVEGPLRDLANRLGLGEDGFRRLAAAAGIVPETVQVLIDLQNNDAAMQDLIVLKSRIDDLKPGSPITIPIDTVDALNKIRGLIGNMGSVVETAPGQYRIEVKDEATRAKLQALVDGLNADGSFGQVNIKSKADPASGTQAGTDLANAAQTAADSNPIVLQVQGPTGGTMNLTPQGVANWNEQFRGMPNFENLPALGPATPVSVGQPAADPAANGGVPPEIQTNVTVTGAPEAIAALEPVKTKTAEVVTAFQTMQQGIIDAMMAAQTSVQTEIDEINAAMDAAATGATERGETLGLNYAAGIRSTIDDVGAAARDMANAATDRMGSSPAKYGPLSGRGWALFRGERVAEDYAKGINAGAAAVGEAAANIAGGVGNALAALQAGPLGFLFGGGTITGTAQAKVTTAQDSSDSRQQAALASAVQENTSAAEQNSRNLTGNTNAVQGNSTATQNLTGQTARQQGLSTGDGRGETLQQVAESFGLSLSSGLRPGDPGYHGSGQAGDFVGTPEQMASFAQWVTLNRPDALELIYSGGGGASGSIKDGAQVDPSFWGAETWAEHADHVHVALAEGVGTAMEVDEAAIGALTDINASQNDVAAAIIRTGRSMNMSNEEIQSAIAVGLVESGLQNIQGGPDSSTGVFQQQNNGQWTANGRDRNNVMDAAASYYEALAQTSGDIGTRMADVQRPREDLRGKYAERFAEAGQIMAQTSGTTLEAAEASGRAADQLVDEEERRQNGGGSGGGSGSGGSGGGGGGGGGEGGALDGIKKFIEMFDHVQKTVDDTWKAFEILRRGPKNTKELNQMIDAFQDMVNDFQKFSEMAGGGGGSNPLGQINDAIDTAQELWRVAGYFIGNALSILAGGPEGPLSGNVRMLLDYNDNTLKTWSENNPEDKREHALRGGKVENNTQNNGINQLVQYLGPGRDPNDVLNQTMYAVRAAQVGAYAQ